MMFYREAGQFNTRYAQDRRVFALRQDRHGLVALLLFAFVVVPWLGNDYWFSAILIPFLVLSLAGLGLNLLTGYAGQLSLGSAAFMAVGAFATYNLEVRVAGLPLLVSIALGGLAAALVAVLFGLPSLRIKGFYLLVSTLAAQFFVTWALTRFSWFSNNSASGVISAPRLDVLGVNLDAPAGRYLLTLSVVVALFWLGKNLVRSELGRNWMAVRDMDTAAAVIGIALAKTKLLAFAISGFSSGWPARSGLSLTWARWSPTVSTSIGRSRSCSSSLSAASAACWATSSARPSSCCFRCCSRTWCRCCPAGWLTPARWRTCRR